MARSVDYAWQKMVISIVPRVSGSVSLVCSMYIVQHVLRSRERRQKTYHRLLLGISANDMLGSFFSFVLATTPMPAGSTYGAIGSSELCSSVGFVAQFANLTSPLYSATLTTYYILMIARGWRESDILKVEWILHAIPLGLGLSIAVAGAIFGIYGPANFTCWVSGDHDIYRLAFMYVHFWTVALYVTFGMIYIYHCVRKQERITERYREPEKKLYGNILASSRNGNNLSPSSTDDTSVVLLDENNPERTGLPTAQPVSTKNNPIARSMSTVHNSKRKSQSRRVANRAMGYVGAMYLTYCFGTLTRVLQAVQNKTYFPLILLMTIFFPLQGFFNYMVYRSSQCVEFQKAFSHLSCHRRLFKAIFTCCSVPTADSTASASDRQQERVKQSRSSSQYLRRTLSTSISGATASFRKLLSFTSRMSSDCNTNSSGRSASEIHPDGALHTTQKNTLEVTDHATILTNSNRTKEKDDDIVIDLQCDEIEDKV